jgi:hypothetical protein
VARADTGSTHDGGTDVRDVAANTGVDAQAYSACIDIHYQVYHSLKTCRADSDCVIEQEDFGRCGGVLEVGINTASVSKFAACEVAWVASLPSEDSGCTVGSVTTESGLVVSAGMDAGVWCVLTADGGLCETSLPRVTCEDGGVIGNPGCTCGGAPLSGACAPDGLLCEACLTCSCTNGEWICVQPECE